MFCYSDKTKLFSVCQVKQRRLEREAERAAREADAAAAARAREALQFHTWAKHEDAFHLHQARLRSQIRIRDGRGNYFISFIYIICSYLGDPENKCGLKGPTRNNKNTYVPSSYCLLRGEV